MVDQRAADALAFLIDQPMAEVTKEVRVSWTRFIMSMLQRGPQKISELRKKWKDAYFDATEETEQNYQSLRGPDDPPTLQEYLEQAPPEIIGRGAIRALQATMDLPKVGSAIASMAWARLELNKSKHPFLTSDKPVIMTNGLAQPDAHIAIPLSPTKLFVGATRDDMIEKIRSMGADAIVASVNRQVTLNAEVFVYSQNDKCLSFVEKHLRRKGA